MGINTGYKSTISVCTALVLRLAVSFSLVFPTNVIAATADLEPQNNLISDPSTITSTELDGAQQLMTLTEVRLPDGEFVDPNYEFIKGPDFSPDHVSELKIEINSGRLNLAFEDYTQSWHNPEGVKITGFASKKNILIYTIDNLGQVKVLPLMASFGDLGNVWQMLFSTNAPLLFVGKWNAAQEIRVVDFKTPPPLDPQNLLAKKLLQEGDLLVLNAQGELIELVEEAALLPLLALQIMSLTSVLKMIRESPVFTKIMHSVLVQSGVRTQEWIETNRNEMAPLNPFGDQERSSYKKWKSDYSDLDFRNRMQTEVFETAPAQSMDSSSERSQNSASDLVVSWKIWQNILGSMYATKGSQAWQKSKAWMNQVVSSTHFQFLAVSAFFASTMVGTRVLLEVTGSVQKLLTDGQYLPHLMLAGVATLSMYPLALGLAKLPNITRTITQAIRSGELTLSNMGFDHIQKILSSKKESAALTICKLGLEIARSSAEVIRYIPAKMATSYLQKFEPKGNDIFIHSKAQELALNEVQNGSFVDAKTSAINPLLISQQYFLSLKSKMPGNYQTFSETEISKLLAQTDESKINTKSFEAQASLQMGLYKRAQSILKFGETPYRSLMRGHITAEEARLTMSTFLVDLFMFTIVHSCFGARADPSKPGSLVASPDGLFSMSRAHFVDTLDLLKELLADMPAQAKTVVSKLGFLPNKNSVTEKQHLNKSYEKIDTFKDAFAEIGKGFKKAMTTELYENLRRTIILYTGTLPINVAVMALARYATSTTGYASADTILAVAGGVAFMNLVRYIYLGGIWTPFQSGISHYERVKYYQRESHIGAETSLEKAIDLQLTEESKNKLLLLESLYSPYVKKGSKTMQSIQRHISELHEELDAKNPDWLQAKKQLDEIFRIKNRALPISYKANDLAKYTTLWVASFMVNLVFSYLSDISFNMSPTFSAHIAGIPVNLEVYQMLILTGVFSFSFFKASKVWSQFHQAREIKKLRSQSVVDIIPPGYPTSIKCHSAAGTK